MAPKRAATRKEPLERIDRPLTLIAQVEQTLRKAVAEGVFPGERLPTSVELAEQLGVSRETVRLALGAMQRDGLLVKHRRRGTFVNPPSVPQALLPRSKVIGYLQADYQPEQGEEDAILGVSSQQMLGGALAEAGDAGYQLLIRSARIVKLRAAWEELSNQMRLCGVLFASIAEEKLLKRLAGLNMPAVLLDHDLNLPRLSSIRPDAFGRARAAVHHLAALGHRRTALAHWHREDLNPWHLRGYRTGMREAGLRGRRQWELFVRISTKGAAQAVESLLAIAPRPTAMICFNNALAALVIAAAAERGLNVPGDLSVIGGGGESVLGLTCMQLDWPALGRKAMRLLIDTIEQSPRHQPQHILMEYRLQPGTTTAAVAEG